MSAQNTTPARRSAPKGRSTTPRGREPGPVLFQEPQTAPLFTQGPDAGTPAEEAIKANRELDEVYAEYARRLAPAERRAIRTTAGLSQRELAKMVEATPQAISKWEANPSIADDARAALYGEMLRHLDAAAVGEDVPVRPRPPRKSDGRTSGRSRPRLAPFGENDYDPVAAMKRHETLPSSRWERVPLGEVYRWMRVKPETIHMKRHRGSMPEPDNDGCYPLPWLIKWGVQEGYFDPDTGEPRNPDLPEMIAAREAQQGLAA